MIDYQLTMFLIKRLIYKEIINIVLDEVNLDIKIPSLIING